MKALLDLELNFPPGINSLYATVNGRRVLSKDGRDYKKGVAALVIQQYGEKTYLPRNTEFVIDINFYHPKPHIYDLDGPLKVLIDAIFGACDPEGCTNDAWIVAAAVKKVLNYKGEPKCTVRLYNSTEFRQEKTEQLKTRKEGYIGSQA